MTEDDKDHEAPVEEKVDEAERELADLEQRSEKLGDEIDERATTGGQEGRRLRPRAAMDRSSDS